MLAILTVTVPFFALVAAGYAAAQRGVLPASAVPGLNAFVLYFALPAMLFRFGMTTPLGELLNPSVLAVYVLSALVLVAVALAWAHRLGLGPQDAGFSALVAAFPNSGFMGVPLLVALMGPVAAGPVISSMLADFFVTSSLCLAWTQRQAPGRPGGSAGALGGWRLLSTPLKNPMPWSIALGAAVGALAIPLPGPVLAVVRMLADAASPVALFTIGAVLWRAQQAPASARPTPDGGHPRPSPSSWRGVGPMALLKLLLHPALVWGLCQAAVAAGLPLGPGPIMALTLCAALPSASNVSLLAERQGADTGRVARIILLSTVVAFLSFSAVAALLGWQPQMAMGSTSTA